MTFFKMKDLEVRLLILFCFFWGDEDRGWSLVLTFFLGRRKEKNRGVWKENTQECLNFNFGLFFLF